MDDCKHNFVKCENKFYTKCSICGNIYNIERLVNELQNKYEQSQHRERVLRDALEFYADKENYITEFYPDTDSGKEAKTRIDNGKIAKEALEASK